MEILENFGFSPGLFVAQIVNFLILAYIFKRFLYKPILSLIKKRENTIQKGLRDAEDAAKSLENAKAEREKILQEASSESKKILAETRESAEGMREEILERARGEGEKIINDAKSQAELEIERIRGEGEKISLALTQSMLENTLSDVFTKDEQKKIIDRTVGKLKKYEN